MAFFVIPIALPAPVLRSSAQWRKDGAQGLKIEEEKKTLIACASLAVPEKRLENFPLNAARRLLYEAAPGLPLQRLAASEKMLLLHNRSGELPTEQVRFSGLLSLLWNNSEKILEAFPSLYSQIVIITSP